MNITGYKYVEGNRERSLMNEMYDITRSQIPQIVLYRELCAVAVVDHILGRGCGLKAANVLHRFGIRGK
jgi:hypothetical protein